MARTDLEVRPTRKAQGLATMTLEIGSHYSLLDELDARQDDLLEQIDQLHRRLELLLTQFAAVPSHPMPPPIIGETEDFAR